MREVTTTSTAEVGRLREAGYTIAGMVGFAPDGDWLYTMRIGSAQEPDRRG